LVRGKAEGYLKHQVYIVLVPVEVQVEVRAKDGHFEAKIDCFTTPSAEDIKRSFAMSRYKNAAEAWAIIEEVAGK